MKIIPLIFGIRLRLIFKYFTPGEFRLPKVTFFIILFLFFTGGYYTFFRIFQYLNTVEIIGPAIMTRTLEMILFVFFIMLLFSNIISSFSTFYNNQELDFLFSLPVLPTTIYLAKLFENALYASWATFAIAIPLILAYGISNSATLIYYPISFLSFVIFLIIPATISSIIIFLLVRFFPRLKPRNIIFISLVLIVLLIMLYIKIGNPGLLQIFETENEKELLLFAANLTTVGGTYVPSTWLSNILKNFVQLNPSGLFYFLLLLFSTLSILAISSIFARIVYHKSFLQISEHSGKRSTRRSALADYQENPIRAFLWKDILLFVREPTQWVQLAIFLILLIVYIFSLRRTPIFFSFSFWNIIISFANFAYVSFVIATLGVRFIFPAISLEKKGLWIIATSPLSFKKVITTKYYFYVTICIIIMEVLLIVANMFIRSAPVVYYVSLFTGLFVAGSLVSINLGFGCVFPYFNEDNPSKIASGSGGIIAALSSIAFIAVVIMILSSPIHNYLISWYFKKPLNKSLAAICLASFFILNFLAIYLPMKFGIRAMKKRDF
ncbi:MAG: putative ABC transporter permease subunit [bacterium]